MHKYVAYSQTMLERCTQMLYFPLMDDRQLIAELEKHAGGKISWHTRASFYADTEGNLIEDGVLLYLTDVTFHCHGPKFECSFDAIDVLYTDDVRKSDVIDLVRGNRKKVSRINPISAIFTDTVLSLDFGDGRMKFLKIKSSEFRQILRIAQAKQKYSTTVNNRNPR